LNKQKKTLLQRFAELSATGYGLGLAKKAPGTWGSLGGLVIGWLIYTAGVEVAHSDKNAYFFTTVSILLTSLSAFGFWSIKRTEAAWGTHDEGKIVIDEFAGQAIAVSFFAPSLGTYIAGFILFRILDIWKPSIIGQADKTLPGAWGTLVDDLIAGAVAAVVLGGFLYFIPATFNG
jgi:phosphatidylglycerophosphatase A